MADKKILFRQIVDAALALIELAEGNIEVARGIWNDLFEEAERLDYNNNQLLTIRTNGSARL